MDTGQFQVFFQELSKITRSFAKLEGLDKTLTDFKQSVEHMNSELQKVKEIFRVIAVVLVMKLLPEEEAKRAKDHLTTI